MHVKNQGVRGAEPPDAGNLKNSSYQVLENTYFGMVRGPKFLENFFLIAIKNFRWTFTFLLNFLRI